MEIILILCKDMRSMPYSQVSEKVMTCKVDNINRSLCLSPRYHVCHYRNKSFLTFTLTHRTIISSNNDFLADIDSDIQLAQSATPNQCKQYNFDEFNNSFSNLQLFFYL